MFVLNHAILQDGLDAEEHPAERLSQYQPHPFETVKIAISAASSAK